MPKDPEECPVCDIASAFSVAKGICNTFRESGLDCSEFLNELENPDGKALDAVQAFLKLRDDCNLPDAKEMLDYVAKAAQLDTIYFEEEESAPKKD